MRKGISACVLYILSICSAGFPLSVSQSVSMFKGNSNLTGVYNSEAVNSLDRVQFVFRTNSTVRSSPVIGDGILYVGSNDGNLYALESISGNEIWKFSTGGSITSTPAVYDGIVWFASRDKYFYALSAKTGKEIWKFKMGNDLSNPDYQDYWDYYLSSPNIYDGKVFIGSGDGYLYAFNCTTKENIWKFNAGSRIRTTPAVYDGSVIFGTMDGHVTAVDLQYGSLKWNFAVDGASYHFDDKSNDRTSVFCSPSVANGIVTIGGRDGFVYGINAETGKLIWKTTHDGSSWILSTAISGNTVYIGSGSALILQAADLKTGKELWRFKTKSGVFSSISITGNTLYFADIAGNVYALDKNTGQKKWQYTAGTRIFSTPLVSEGMVYFGSDDGNVYALKGSTAEPPDTLSPIKIVYREGLLTDTSFAAFQFDTDLWLRDYFISAGYKLMNTDQLVSFLKDKDYKNRRSVIVLADNKIPNAVIQGKPENCLLRKYLDEGGKIAAFGDNPLAYILDPATGVLTDIDYKPAENILGVKFVDPRDSRGYYPSRITEDGRKLGLHDFWTGTGFVVNNDPSIQVLAVNEYGKTAAWIKNYGGPKGTGWLQLNAMSYKGVMGELIYQFKAVIEYGIEW